MARKNYLELSNLEKARRTDQLFKQIERIWGTGHNISLSIHNVDITAILADESYVVETVENTTDPFRVAHLASDSILTDHPIYFEGRV
jgi:hypothetical protein